MNYLWPILWACMLSVAPSLGATTVSQSIFPATGNTPGSTIIYTIVIDDLKVAGYDISDTNAMPGQFTSVVASAGTPSFSGNQFSATYSAPAPKSVTITATFAVSSGASVATYGNTIVVDPVGGQANTVNTIDVTLIAGTTTLASTLVTNHPDYGVKAGILYTGSVINAGIATALNVVLNFTTSAPGPLFVSNFPVSNPYIVNLGNIGGGQMATYNIQQAVPTSDPLGLPTAPGTHSAYAFAVSSNASPTSSDVEFRLMNVTVRKTPSDTTIAPGQTFTYTIDLQNPSRINYTSGFVVNDTTTLPGVFNSVVASNGATITDLVIGSNGFVAVIGDLPATLGSPYPKLIASFTANNPLDPGTYTNKVVLSSDIQGDTFWEVAVVV